MKYRYFWIILLAIFTIGCAEDALLTILDGGSDATITAPPEEVWEVIREMVTTDIAHFYEPDEAQKALIEKQLSQRKDFYTKYIDAAGIAILANAGVADEHLIEARHIIVALTSKRPELRDMLQTQNTKDEHILVGHGFYTILVDHLVYLPEFGDHFINGLASCSLKGSRQSGVI